MAKKRRAGRRWVRTVTARHRRNQTCRAVTPDQRWHERDTERHQIRRVPVVDDGGRCTGIIAQADLAWEEPLEEVGELVREVSRETGRESR